MSTPMMDRVDRHLSEKQDRNGGKRPTFLALSTRDFYQLAGEIAMYYGIQPPSEFNIIEFQGVDIFPEDAADVRVSDLV